MRLNRKVCFSFIFIAISVWFTGCSSLKIHRGVDDSKIQKFITDTLESGTYDTLIVTGHQIGSGKEKGIDTIFLEATKEHSQATEAIELSLVWLYDEYTNDFYEGSLQEESRSITLKSNFIGQEWTDVPRHWSERFGSDIFEDTIDISVYEASSSSGISLYVIKKDIWSAFWNRLDTPPETDARISCPELTYFEDSQEWGISLSALNGLLYDVDDTDNFDEEDYLIFSWDYPGSHIESVNTRTPRTTVAPIYPKELGGDQNNSTSVSDTEGILFSGNDIDDSTPTPGNDLLLSEPTAENLYAGTGEADGFNDKVRVTITVDNSQSIVDVEIEEQDSPNIGSRATSSLISNLMGSFLDIDDGEEYGVLSSSIDAVTGATFSLKAQIAAAKEAYAIAYAKSLETVSYDQQNPICGVWRGPQYEDEIGNTIWYISPEGTLECFFTYDDSADEDALGIEETCYNISVTRNSYSYSNGHMILSTTVGDSIFRTERTIIWTDNDHFSFCSTDGKEVYWSAERIYFE